MALPVYWIYGYSSLQKIWLLQWTENMAFQSTSDMTLPVYRIYGSSSLQHSWLFQSTEDIPFPVYIIYEFSSQQKIWFLKSKEDMTLPVYRSYGSSSLQMWTKGVKIHGFIGVQKTWLFQKCTVDMALIEVASRYGSSSGQRKPKFLPPSPTNMGINQLTIRYQRYSINW